jgi:hypothetical protein
MTGTATFYCRRLDGGEPMTVGFRLPGEAYPDPSAMFQHEDSNARAVQNWAAVR